MSDFFMNFVGVSTAIDHMQQKTTEIDRRVTTLEEQSEKSLASWDGDAKEQYRQEKDVWHDAIMRMKAGMTKLHTALGNIHSNTLTTEKKNTANWSGAGTPG